MSNVTIHQFELSIGNSLSFSKKYINILAKLLSIVETAANPGTVLENVDLPIQEHVQTYAFIDAIFH